MRNTGGVINALLVSALIFGLYSDSLSKDWRGLLPLKSTKSEVEKILGAGRELSPGMVEYRFAKEKISVTYSRGRCNEELEAEWDAPKHKVISIVVSPRKPIALDKILERFEDFEKLPGDKDLPGTYYFLNEKEGMSMAVQTQRDLGNSIVTTFFYFPMATERRYKCFRE
jgi:hypothetical protein